MLTFKDYAKQKNISYEAVRKSVIRYKEELESHIIKQGRTQYLDDEAIEFLDNKRKHNPVVLVEDDKNQRIEELEQENKMLLLKVAQLQESLLQEKDQVKILQNEKIELLASQKKSLLQRIFG